MGKTLRADIIVGGKADNSFYALGGALETLGGQVNQISEKLIQFGKESVQTYASYEDYMLDTEVALRTQYSSTNALAKVMEELDKAAMQWASNSRFTTEDVAGAISNAAHAGWNLEKMLAGVPSAMKISLAGGMDLAEGLEYLVDISNAAGIQFEDLGLLVDYWAYAANRSSTTIPEMGQAMQKMGATMQFVKGDMAGLTTMLGVLANNGTKGTEAGTLLRNSFLRLIAPTKKAAETLDGLAISGEDLDEIYSNTAGLEEAAAMLEEAGFSAYDAGGQLKSFMTVWQELDKATAGMTEQDRNKVLSAIFPTRTITAALALLKAASKDWDGLYASILENGAGYADYAAEKMESGLGGALRHLESAYNALQTKSGKELAEDVTAVANALTGMIESVNNMDDAAFGAIVSGLEVVAAAGPGLMAAGGALKLIGAIAGTGIPGQLVLAAIGLTAVANGMDAFNNSVYEAQFGELGVDMGAIESYLNTMGSDFNAAAEKINGYNSAVAEALETYRDLVTGLKSDLVTGYITEATLTQEQIDHYYHIGQQMTDAVKAGIEGNYSASMEILGYLAGEDPRELNNGEDSVAKSILDLLTTGYEDSIAQAESLSQQLREAMFKAFEDKELSDAEIANINSIMQAYNELMNQQAEAALRAKTDIALEKALALGKDGADEVAKIASDVYATGVEQAYAYKEQVLTTAYSSNGNKDLPQEQRDLIDQGFADKMAQARVNANKPVMAYWEQMARESDLSEAYQGTADIAQALLKGYITPEMAHEMYRDRYGSNKYANEMDWGREETGTQMGRFLAEYIAGLGGQAAVEEQIAYLQRSGNAEEAANLQMLYAMEQLANNYAVTGISEGVFGTGIGAGVYARHDITKPAHVDSFLDSVDSYTAQVGDGLAYAGSVLEKNADVGEYLAGIADVARGKNEDWESIIYGAKASTERDTAAVVAALKSEYDFGAILSDSGIDFTNSAIGEEFAAWRILLDETFDAEAYRLQVIPEVDESGLEALGNGTIPVEIVPRQGDMGLEELENQGVTVDVEGDTTTLSATINAEDGKTLLEYVDGDAENLSMVITDQDGRTLTEIVGGDTSALAAAIEAYNGKVVTVRVNYISSGQMKMHASGGRADEPSIFGEAGPEWAIPERHTQETAKLLDQAREASGFTWPELISRTGADAAPRGNWTLVYSPVIHAANADGVEQKLREDKTRLEKWLRDKQLHDEVEVYA